MTILKAFFKSFVLFFVGMSVLTTTLNAQNAVLRPLENNPQVIDYWENSPLQYARNNQVCPDITLSLPFFDDFATQTSIHPDCNRWQDNHVYINADMASNPPSIGVATFDGLSPNGSPYDVGSPVSVGAPADTLTSQNIDLSGKTAADAIYLSFFYQKQGLSDRPEKQDSFIVEFKDDAGAWLEVWKECGVPDSVSTLAILPFNQQYIRLDSAYFFHNAFQFRFRNLASISGNNDHWHLDYVMLDENRANNADTLNPAYGRYADVTFTHRPSTPLANNYTAMPWRHFNQNDGWSDSLVLRNFNHNASGGATLDRRCTIEEISPNPMSLLTEGIPAVPVYQPSPNSDDGLKHAIVNTHSSFAPMEKTVLKTTYTILSPGGFQNNPIFFDNDTVCTETVLDNYFAYDDGTAETRIIAQGQGTKIAVQFKAEVKDTIQGIYFHLPYFTNRNAELDFVNVKVWLDSLSNDSEVFSRDLHNLQYRYGFNGWYFVDLVDFLGDKYLVPVEPGQTFYVGWQQSFGPEVPVGFDRSTNNSDKTFVGVGTNWWQSDVDGTVMIRPLLSPDPNFTTIPITKVETPSNELTIYPNPVQHTLTLELENYELASDYIVQVHNALGQVIYTAPFERELQVYSWTKGMYVLTLRDEKGQQVAQKKIIKN